MSLPVIIGAGSCIIQAILQQFATIPGLADKADLHLSQITGGGRDPVPPEVLARATILIEEAAPWQGSGSLGAEERGLLAEGCATVTVPTLHFNSLWPLMTEDPRNRPEPGAPYGRLPFGMGDRLALRLFQTMPVGARKAAYDATEFRSVANLAQSHELEVRNCFAREQGCDVRTAAFVMSHFREKRLYFTHSHPTGELMYFILCQLFAVPVLRDFIKVPYDQLVVLARHWADTANVFVGEEAPIHPAVARHFDLKWWRPDMRFHWLGRGMTFDEWISFYLTYDPDGAAMAPAPAPPPDPAPAATPFILPVGPFMQAMPGGSGTSADLVLSLAQRIERAAPFTSSPIDPALSPYGHHFTTPGEAAYEVSAAVVKCLPGGSVLGEEGLIIADGRIVADSFRNFPLGPTAPLVARASAAGAELHPGMPRVTRHLAGPYFCGFSGLWSDYGHWLFGSLPRLVAFLARREQIPGLRLILPRLAPGSIQAETVALLGIDPACIEVIGDGEQLVCEDLYVTSAFDLWRVSPFAHLAASRLVEAWAAGGGVEAGFDRLHIAPSPGGSRQDDPMLAATLALRGFQSVSFEGMSLARQIALLRGARYIVAEAGGAMANLFFARPGCRVIEIFDPRNVQPMYWSVAAVSGHDYGYQVGTLLPSGKFTVGGDLLRWAIDQMLLLPAPGEWPAPPRALAMGHG